MMETRKLSRRTWVYVMPPKAFEMAGCSCGNTDTQWSEFEHHLWCEKCQKDFVPKHNGIFDGPIPARVAHMMGIRFDRVIISTGEVERFNMDTGTWEKEKHHEKGNPGRPTGKT